MELLPCAIVVALAMLVLAIIVGMAFVFGMSSAQAGVILPAL